MRSRSSAGDLAATANLYNSTRRNEIITTNAAREARRLTTIRPHQPIRKWLPRKVARRAAATGQNTSTNAISNG